MCRGDRWKQSALRCAARAPAPEQRKGAGRTARPLSAHEDLVAPTAGGGATLALQTPERQHRGVFTTVTPTMGWRRQHATQMRLSQLVAPAAHLCDKSRSAMPFVARVIAVPPLQGNYHFVLPITMGEHVFGHLAGELNRSLAEGGAQWCGAGRRVPFVRVTQRGRYH